MPGGKTTEKRPKLSGRIPPLNLTADETEALWQMVKIGIGSEEIQYSDIRDDAESVHMKVRELVYDE
jgi:hypothetical protein